MVCGLSEARSGVHFVVMERHPRAFPYIAHSHTSFQTIQLPTDGHDANIRSPKATQLRMPFVTLHHIQEQWSSLIGCLSSFRDGLLGRNRTEFGSSGSQLSTSEQRNKNGHTISTDILPAAELTRTSQTTTHPQNNRSKQPLRSISIP